MQVLSKASQRLSNSYEILRGFGLVEFRRNNLKEAIAYLLRAQKIYENDPETLILLARVQANMGQHKEASVSASRAVEMDGTNSEAQIVFAKTIAQLYGMDQQGPRHGAGGA
jgi:Flp pilus assembly protein TadD